MSNTSDEHTTPTEDSPRTLVHALQEYLKNSGVHEGDELPGPTCTVKQVVKLPSHRPSKSFFERLKRGQEAISKEIKSDPGS